MFGGDSVPGLHLNPGSLKRRRTAYSFRHRSYDWLVYHMQNEVVKDISA